MFPSSLSNSFKTSPLVSKKKILGTYCPSMLNSSSFFQGFNETWNNILFVWLFPCFWKCSYWWGMVDNLILLVFCISYLCWYHWKISAVKNELLVVSHHALEFWNADLKYVIVIHLVLVGWYSWFLHKLNLNKKLVHNPNYEPLYWNTFSIDFMSNLTYIIIQFCHKKKWSSSKDWTCTKRRWGFYICLKS